MGKISKLPFFAHDILFYRTCFLTLIPPHIHHLLCILFSFSFFLLFSFSIWPWCTYSAAISEGSADSNRRAEDNSSCDGGGGITIVTATNAAIFISSFYFQKKTFLHACSLHFLLEEYTKKERWKKNERKILSLSKNKKS